MTVQIPDLVVFEGQTWFLQGVEHPPLLPTAWLDEVQTYNSSACVRGYTAEFVVQDGQLMLDSLQADLMDPFQTFLGHAAQATGPEGAFVFPHLQQPLAYSGGLLLCQGFIPELRVNSGFQRPWKFEQVQEWVFQNGKPCETRDVSRAMQTLRESFAAMGNPTGKYTSMDTLKDWVEVMFSLEYDSARLLDRWSKQALYK